VIATGDADMSFDDALDSSATAHDDDDNDDDDDDDIDAHAHDVGSEGSAADGDSAEYDEVSARCHVRNLLSHTYTGRRVSGRRRLTHDTHEQQDDSRVCRQNVRDSDHGIDSDDNSNGASNNDTITYIGGRHGADRGGRASAAIRLAKTLQSRQCGVDGRILQLFRCVMCFEDS
jgi:hypothetical protein